MKRFTWTMGIVFTAGVVTAFAQPPGGPGRGGQGGGPRGPGGNRPPMPVIEVLDADHDHVISANELKNATTSLLTLDKNHDGKLSESEFGPQGGAPGGQRQAGPGANGRGTGGTGRRPQQGLPDGGGERGPGGPGRNEDAGPPPPNPARMVEHAMEFDLDKDGKLSPSELAKFAEDFERHHRGPGGPGEGRPGDPENDRPSDTDRPRRPD